MESNSGRTLAWSTLDQTTDVPAVSPFTENRARPRRDGLREAPEVVRFGKRKEEFPVDTEDLRVIPEVPLVDADKVEASANPVPDSVARLQSQISGLEARLEEARAEARSQDLARRELEAQLSDHVEEMAKLTRLLLEAERDAAVAHGLVRTIMQSLFRPGRRRFLSRLIFRRIYAALRRSGDFDERWYLANNADVSGDGTDAAKHFLLFGYAEKRLPKEMGPLEIWRWKTVKN